LAFGSNKITCNEKGGWGGVLRGAKVGKKDGRKEEEEEGGVFRHKILTKKTHGNGRWDQYKKGSIRCSKAF
jgi:hypothetical protein